MIRSIEYGRETIRFDTLFLATRKTLAIEVHPDRRVLVRAPIGCSERVVAERVHRRAPWILKQLAVFRRYEPRTPARHFVSGETHLYLGRQYRLKVRPGSKSGVLVKGGRIVVTLAGAQEPKRTRDVLNTWYRERARELFNKILAERLRVVPCGRHARIVIRNLRFRWGSMSAAGTMTLNSSLIQAPRPCIEYVVAHELCHLGHRNHDVAFYRLLRKVMPEWEMRKRRLETALL